jgi:hypothetical protein
MNPVLDSGKGVGGTEEVVKESLKSIAGAFARGVSGLIYGISGCLEYGKTGKTVMTSTAHVNIQKDSEQEDTSCTCSFTSTQHDKQFHEYFINLTASRSNNEDIFPSYTFLDLHSCFAIAEFAECHRAFSDAQTSTYRFCQRRMGRTS